MSYIDTQPHEHCGFLAGLPLYHPQAFYKDELDFVAGPQHLVLGGGSGEHSAAIFNPAGCASSIIGDLIIQMLELEDLGEDEAWYQEEMFRQYGIVEADLTKLEAALEAICGWRDGADFSSWGGDDWHSFVEEAKVSGLRPYSRDHTSIERWAIDAIGEYVLVCRPAMLYTRNELMGHRKTIDAVTRFLARSPRHANVLQPPIGYNCYGRGEAMSDPNMAH